MKRRETTYRKIDKYVYNPEDHLGSGTWGKVYKGKSIEKPDTFVAIKAIDIKQTDNKTLFKLLENEVLVMKKIDSQHCCRLLDTYYTANHFYIITEYCNGGDLRGFFSKLKEPLKEKQARTIIKDIIKGLEDLSKCNIIHRDLKPENILIHNNNFKIADFGLSKCVDNFQNQILSSIVGSPLYMAPQVIQETHYTSKCDIWSLGVIYYEMLFGKTPWPSTNVKDLIKKTTIETLKFPFHIFLTPMSKDFLKGCLILDENSRYSLEDVLNHGVYQKPTSKLSIYEVDMTKKVILDEKSKEIIKKIQKMIANCGISVEGLFGSLSPTNNAKGELTFDDFNELISVIDKECPQETIAFLFHQLDEDDNKTISLEEFKHLFFEADYNDYELYKDPFLEERKYSILVSLKAIADKNKMDMFALFNMNGEKKLSFEKFMEMLRIIDLNISKKEVEYIFQSIDTDKSGTIEFNEFKTAMESVKTDDLTKKLKEIEKKMEIKEKKIEQIEKNVNNISKESQEMITFIVSLVNAQKLTCEKVFYGFDVDKRYSLNFKNFKEMLRIVDENVKEEVVKELFDNFSNKTYKEVGIKEFKKMLGVN